MKKVYISISIIIIVSCIVCSVYAFSYNNKKVTIDEVRNLMDDMPATDYERDLDKATELINSYKNNTTSKSDSKISTVKKSSVNIPIASSGEVEEEAKIKLSSCYRAYKKGTLNYDILYSAIDSDIAALEIDLNGAKQYKKDDELIRKIENLISVCEKYLKIAQDGNKSSSVDVYKLYEEYEQNYNTLKSEINKKM